VTGQSQLTVLNVLTRRLASTLPALLPKTSAILSALYFANILEEDKVLEWHCNKYARSDEQVAIRKHAEPFIKWLQYVKQRTDCHRTILFCPIHALTLRGTWYREAEEDDDDDDDDE
jgi:hypothetical protein